LTDIGRRIDLCWFACDNYPIDQGISIRSIASRAQRDLVCHSYVFPRFRNFNLWVNPGGANLGSRLLFTISALESLVDFGLAEVFEFAEKQDISETLYTFFLTKVLGRHACENRC